MPNRVLDDPQKPIQLYVDDRGHYYLRIDDRIGHMEAYHDGGLTEQEAIAAFHDTAEEYSDGAWDLDAHAAGGGHVEDFAAWHTRHAGPDGAPGAVTHVATHQS